MQGCTPLEVLATHRGNAIAEDNHLKIGAILTLGPIKLSDRIRYDQHFQGIQALKGYIGDSCHIVWNDDYLGRKTIRLISIAVEGIVKRIRHIVGCVGECFIPRFNRQFKCDIHGFSNAGNREGPDNVSIPYIRTAFFLPVYLNNCSIHCTEFEEIPFPGQGKNRIANS